MTDARTTSLRLWPTISKVLRYSVASLVTTTVSLALLAALMIWVTAGWANLIAVGAASVVSFELNRRWVWREADSQARLIKMVVFICTAFIFLALSVLAVHVAMRQLATGRTSDIRALVVEGTTLCVLGSDG